MPIPENDTQGKIRPSQFIVHSIVAPWAPERLRQFWNNPKVTVESHFGVGYDGAVGQFLETTVRADANASANSRAVSVETASNTKATDKWTPAQVDALVRLMVWANREHSIPARICRTATDPGFGIHMMFPVWSGGGTACPGAARARQFLDEVFPEFLSKLKTGGASPHRPMAVKLSDLAFGAENCSVLALQAALIHRGYVIPGGPTGRYDDFTLSAVRAFQLDQGWSGPGADGLPGPETCRRLGLSL